jgi:DNA polymerase III subunit beta
MRIERRLLYEALKELVRVIDPKASMPILSHVLLEVFGGKLTVTATDLNRTLSCRLPAEGDIDTCLPAKLLATLIKPEGKEAGDVTIEPADNTCSVTFEGLTSKITTMPSTDFPKGPELSLSLIALWPTAPFLDVLSWVLPAVSTDQGRPHLNGVCLDLDRIVATDGHRLHMAPAPTRLNGPLLLPLEAAQTLARVLAVGEQVVIARAGEHVRFGAGHWQLTTKLVDARFPPCDKVVPVEGAQPVNVQLEKALFSKALARVSRLTKSKAVRLRINGAITITSSDPDLGEAEVMVPVVMSDHAGEDLVLGVDPSYLRDAVGSSGETFRMSFNGPSDAIPLDLDGDRVAVVMPFRL